MEGLQWVDKQMEHVRLHPKKAILLHGRKATWGRTAAMKKRKPMLSESPITVEEYWLSVAVSRDAVNARFR